MPASISLSLLSPAIPKLEAYRKNSKRTINSVVFITYTGLNSANIH